MNNKKYDFVVYIGRFSPFHNGHLAVLRQAANISPKVIVLLGSAHEPRTTKNPWNIAERSTMILESAKDIQDQLILEPLRDTLYNEDEWVAQVQAKVFRTVLQHGGDEKSRVAIIGMEKDASSYYLKSFPQWDFVPAIAQDVLSATDIRHYLFDADQTDCHGALLMVRSNVPESVYSMLEAYRKSSPDWKRLVEEYQFVKTYKKQWEASPYPPTFVTCDAVVIHSGHVLLVERGANPGKGLWALPGGFVGQRETVFDACVRELYEETNIKLSERTLRNAKPEMQIFDHPERETRGRTITHAFCFRFPQGELPKVKGGDDAASAQWVPLAQVMSSSGKMFSDHWHIIRHFCPVEIY